nr:hypothetical protein [Tanacetum cinerariifolium]
MVESLLLNLLIVVLVFFADNANANRNLDGAKACLVDLVKCVAGCELIYRLANGEKVKPSGGGGQEMSLSAQVQGSGDGFRLEWGLQPSSLRVDGGGFSGNAYLRGPGASYGKKGSGREVGLGIGFGPFGGHGSSYGSGSQAPKSLKAVSVASYDSLHFGGPGLSYDGTGSCGGVELGT